MPIETTRYRLEAAQRQLAHYLDELEADTRLFISSSSSSSPAVAASSPPSTHALPPLGSCGDGEAAPPAQGWAASVVQRARELSASVPPVSSNAEARLLLTYAPPTSALAVVDPMAGFDLLNIDDDGDDDGAHAGGAGGAMPITAALLGARDAPLFRPAALTAAQVHDVLHLRQIHERYGPHVRRIAVQLSSLVGRLQALLDGEAGDLCAALGRLAQFPHEQRGRRFPVPSGGADDDNTTTAGNAAPRSLSYDEVVSLQQDNKRRLEAARERWAQMTARHAALVERSNHVMFHAMSKLDEEEGLRGGNVPHSVASP